MLLELSDDILTELDEQERLALELIIHSRRLGYHLLWGSDDLFRHLPDVVTSLSESARATLRQAWARQVQKADLRDSVKCLVTISRAAEPRARTLGEVTQVTLPLSHFRDLCTPAESVVLGENVYDARLAIQMARYYQEAHGLLGAKLRYRADGGGGSTTAETFRGYRDDPRFCICIVDSDAVAPDAPVGRTATGVMALKRQGKPWAQVVILPCRTAENMLCNRMLRIALGRKQEIVERVTELEVLGGVEILRQVRDHCNIKKGTSLKWVYSLEEEVARRFWLRVVAMQHEVFALQRECTECEECLEPTHCQCWIIRGLHGKVLPRCVEAIEGMKPTEVSSALCEATRPHWTHIGGVVFSWICGTQMTIV